MTRHDERGPSIGERRWLLAAVVTGAVIVSGIYATVILVVLRSGSPTSDAPLLALAAIGAALLIAGAAGVGMRIDRRSQRDRPDKR